MVYEEAKKIFKEGSTTYFYSSLFFPKNVREDVFRLYAFVRTADDFVDKKPPEKENFTTFKQKTLRALDGEDVDNKIIKGFYKISKKHDFKKQWIKAFLEAMEKDLHKKTYDTIDETKQYMYGSAEVIGLFLSRIMDLDKAYDEQAKMLGRSMQYINFIRDINEDLRLGRRYIPTDVLESHDLESLEEDHTRQHPEEFKEMMRDEIRRYKRWKRQAEEGYEAIPHSYLVPIKTASDMYSWTADQIKEDPFIIYEEKIKPSKYRICKQIMMNKMRDII